MSPGSGRPVEQGGPLGVQHGQQGFIQNSKNRIGETLIFLYSTLNSSLCQLPILRTILVITKIHHKWRLLTKYLNSGRKTKTYSTFHNNELKRNHRVFIEFLFLGRFDVLVPTGAHLNKTRKSCGCTQPLPGKPSASCRRRQSLDETSWRGASFSATSQNTLNFSFTVDIWKKYYIVPNTIVYI